MDDETHQAASSATTEPIIILLNHNSLFNDTYDCDWAGIHYRVSTPTEGIKTERLTSISRWDTRTHEEVVVAEWLWNWTGDDKFKFTNRPDMPNGFQLVKDVYPRTWGYWYGGFTNRTFLAENGKRYTWKERTVTLKLYRAEGDTREPIAEYHRPNHLINKPKAILKLQPEALEFLDSLIVTFLYSENKHRTAEKLKGKGEGGP